MENQNNEIIIKGRLTGAQRNRFSRLLDMMYTPAELAKEIGFNQRQVYRVYVKLGCPHEYTHSGRKLWINGKAFREWYRETYKKARLEENETFCLTCRKPVDIVNPEKITTEKRTFLKSKCPNCDRPCVRYIEHEG